MEERKSTVTHRDLEKVIKNAFYGHSLRKMRLTIGKEWVRTSNGDANNRKRMNLTAQVS